MARDRRRAKQRRDRQARAGGDGKARPKDGSAREREAEESLHEHEAPELATGEVDLAEAQLEEGRPRLADAVQPGPEELIGAAGEHEVEGDEATFEALEDRVDEAEERFERGEPFEEGSNGHDEDGADVVRQRTAVAQADSREGNRLANFLRGSWRELQRVQWPDRRQVGQATAVTVGFVFVAGSFLGLMDFLASKIVDFIV